MVLLALASAASGWSSDGGGASAPLADGSTPTGASGELSIAPLDDLVVRPGTDPAELQRTFLLANESGAPIAWEARVSQPWLSVAGPTSGTLAAGESIAVSVDVDPVSAGAGEEGAVGCVDFVEPASGKLLASGTVLVEPSFLGLSSGGWTTFARSADTRAVFVSSSRGDDRADGLSPATPKRTLAAGQALLRHGHPDWLLLRRGDVWHESLQQWKKSGRSLGEPMVVSTYGESLERPLLLTGNLHGIRTHGGGGSPATIDFLALVGLHFRADGYTGDIDCVGAQLLQPGEHVLIEDCKFEGYSTNLVFQGLGGRLRDYRLRRSVIVDAYRIHDTGAHPQGLYAYAVDGLLIEENVFDHNGWSESVPGAGADIYSHNLYIDNDNTRVLVRGNVIANASSHGLQLRPGGTVVDNLFVRNSIALLVGGGNAPEVGGVRATVLGNVIVDGKDIDAANPRGWGMLFANIAEGLVAYNVVASNRLGRQPVAMTLDGDQVGDTRPSIGVHGLRIECNVFYDWGGGVQVEGDASLVTDIVFRRNDVQILNQPDALIAHDTQASMASFLSAGNRFFSPLQPVNAWTQIENVPHAISYWMGRVGDTTSVMRFARYREPGRTVGSYNALLGGKFSLAGFLGEARLQSWGRWRPEYEAASVNHYLRTGF